MMFRITVRGDNVELRGRLDGGNGEALRQFGQAMRPWGIVIASPAVKESGLEPDQVVAGLEEMRANERDGRVDTELALQVLQLAMDEIDRLRRTLHDRL